jgi:hypothetical protein
MIIIVKNFIPKDFTNLKWYSGGCLMGCRKMLSIVLFNKFRQFLQVHIKRCLHSIEKGFWIMISLGYCTPPQIAWPKAIPLSGAYRNLKRFCCVYYLLPIMSNDVNCFEGFFWLVAIQYFIHEVSV